MTLSTPSKSPFVVHNRLRNLPTYVFAWLDELKETARARGANLIDLGIGSPDQPIPSPIIEAIQAGFANPPNHRYPPFKGTEAFLEAVAGWMKTRYGLTIDAKTQALCLSGSKEGLAHLTMAYVGNGDVSLVPNIYYPVLSRATWLTGGDVYHMPVTPQNGFLPDLDAIPPNVCEKARLLFLNYPNNPTGAVANKAFYEKAIAFCKQHNILLVSDLAYAEITFDGYVAPSIFEIPGAEDIAIEFYSFSKSFNMAGARIGWVVGNPTFIQNLYALRTNVGYGTPSAIQDGAVVALQNGSTFSHEVSATYQKRRDIVVQGFQKLGWPIEAPKATLYVWLPVPMGYTSKAWTEYVLDNTDVVVSPGHAFGDGGEGWFRISLVSSEAVLQEAIDRFESKGIRYA